MGIPNRNDGHYQMLCKQLVHDVTTVRAGEAVVAPLVPVGKFIC